MEHKETVPKSETSELNFIGAIIFCIFIFFLLFLLFSTSEPRKIYVPDITISFMNFTMFNINETRFNANWNLSIRVPENLPGSYICLQGDFHASLLYKNTTIANSPSQSYNLQPLWAQLLRVSGIVSEEDTIGAVGKNVMNDIKESSEVRFGLRLFLSDCRTNTTGTMSYTCDEVKLRFDSSFQKITTTTVGNSTCHYDDHYSLC